jgi:hypothetical protein
VRVPRGGESTTLIYHLRMGVRDVDHYRRSSADCIEQFKRAGLGGNHEFRAKLSTHEIGCHLG